MDHARVHDGGVMLIRTEARTDTSHVVIKCIAGRRGGPHRGDTGTFGREIRSMTESRRTRCLTLLPSLLYRRLKFLDRQVPG